MIKTSETSINFPLTFFLARICETELADPDVQVSSTLMFEQGRPVVWYDHVPMGGGEMKPRLRRDLTSKKVLKTWGKRTQNKGTPLAIFIGYQKAAKGSIDGIGTTSVQHLSHKRIDDLFSQADPNMKGILIPFHLPVSGYNSLIRANWSRHFFHCERRTNNLKLSTVPLSGDERPFPANTPHFSSFGNVVTFEGCESLSSAAPVNPALQQKLRRFCDTLADLVKGSQRVLQFTAYFKVGKNNTIWFLWTSSVKLCKANVTEVCTVRKGKHIPFNEQVHRGVTRSGTPDLLLPPWTPKMQHSSQCADCGRKMSLYLSYLLPFSAVVAKHDQALADEEARLEKAFDALCKREKGAAAALDAEPLPAIPPLFAKHLGNISLSRWQTLKTQQTFLSQSTYCCFACASSFLDNPEPVVQSMPQTKPSQEAPSPPKPQWGTRGISRDSRRARLRSSQSPRERYPPGARSGALTDRPRTTSAVSEVMPRVLLPSGHYEATPMTARAYHIKAGPASPEQGSRLPSSDSVAWDEDLPSRIPKDFRLNPKVFRGLSNLREYEYHRRAPPAYHQEGPALAPSPLASPDTLPRTAPADPISSLQLGNSSFIPSRPLTTAPVSSRPAPARHSHGDITAGSDPLLEVPEGRRTAVSFAPPPGGKPQSATRTRTNSSRSSRDDVAVTDTGPPSPRPTPLVKTRYQHGAESSNVSAVDPDSLIGASGLDFFQVRAKLVGQWLERNQNQIVSVAQFLKEEEEEEEVVRPTRRTKLKGTLDMGAAPLRTPTSTTTRRFSANSVLSPSTSPPSTAIALWGSEVAKHVNNAASIAE
mmetsp:Transcript_9700/g.22246  ORF Transcript_9700/g.22246 Transcript_9700/m.22246 type:complete len:817 (-) Transcript_9700:25-2475(-)